MVLLDRSVGLRALLACVTGPYPAVRASTPFMSQQLGLLRAANAGFRHFFLHVHTSDGSADSTDSRLNICRSFKEDLYVRCTSCFRVGVVRPAWSIPCFLGLDWNRTLHIQILRNGSSR